MYMYYFIGFQLLENNKLSEKQREVRAYNTFLLALDGDVDFLPEAVFKVVDLIKRNHKIGAACGRIHPTGTGYMKWYQEFEYAIGHWLQKATEHVLGCVLCSPGCFSLFRARAVMDENVMRTYTTVASQPRHHIQYDQGEDRWLCTLMLKQGWRVEYSAASDSYTACPESFKIFYNQRRRWMPSTMLNVFDLIGDWKAVVKENDNITSWYMYYQLFNLVGSIIGPGSIFLMLIGAFSLAFGLSSTTSLLLNLALVSVFIAACCTLKSDNQILIAQFLTLVYAIIMIAVYIGIILQIIEDGPLSLSALGFFFTFGSFVFAAMLHPQEWRSIYCCVVYVATIPSMYLLLTVYSVFNMNDVSWGTREVPKTVENETNESQKPADAPKNSEKGGFLGYFHQLFSKTDGFGISSLFSKNTEQNYLVMKKLGDIENSIGRIEKNQGNSKVKTEDPSNASAAPSIKGEKENIEEERKVINEKMEKEEKQKKKEEEEENENSPYWFKDNDYNKERCSILANASEKHLGPDEKIFWEAMIKKYLLPAKKDEAQQKKEEEEKKQLTEFKNSMALGFVLLNAMWVTAIFMLQAYTDILGMQWPLGAKG